MLIVSRRSSIKTLWEQAEDVHCVQTWALAYNGQRLTSNTHNSVLSSQAGVTVSVKYNRLQDWYSEIWCRNLTAICIRDIKEQQCVIILCVYHDTSHSLTRCGSWNPSRFLASSTSFLHSFLLFAKLISFFILLISSITWSFHPLLGLPTGLFPSIVLFHKFAIESSCFLRMCPAH